jgi:hypothetical protein
MLSEKSADEILDTANRFQAIAGTLNRIHALMTSSSMPFVSIHFNKTDEWLDKLENWATKAEADAKLQRRTFDRSREETRAKKSK